MFNLELKRNGSIDSIVPIKYQKLTVSPEPASFSHTSTVCKLSRCIDLRKKWISIHPIYSVVSSCTDSIEHATDGTGIDECSPNYSIFDRDISISPIHATHKIQFVHGVANVVSTADPISNFHSVLTFEDFVLDYNEVRAAVHSGPLKSYAYKRLALLDSMFGIHILLNADKELEEQKAVPFRDVSTCRKVDTHVHHSGCMTQMHLLRFIRDKLKTAPNDIVTYKDGSPVTLAEAFAGLKLTAAGLSIDAMDMHAHDTFHRFDRFNLKFNPAGEGLLREIFLKTDNALNGRYLAEITKEVITELEENKYTVVEWRVSIYGRKPTEWRSLAQWFYAHRLAHYNVRWLVQVPRIYHVYRATDQIASFGDMLRNIFEPLFENALDPSADPALHYFLEAVVGFDSVDDESLPEHALLSASLPAPDDYRDPHNPPYAYWMYYMYANICVLNQLRASQGLHSFEFRPHCGEAGDPDHLIAAFLVAHQVNHGLLLRRSPALHYLFYLTQIGIAMSPLCNSKLFVSCSKNPFPRYFRQGMNVSLSTDAPLLTHHTNDALAEEYAVCAQMWKFSSTDQCEIARNSVLQSGLELPYKEHFLGKSLAEPHRTNVPRIRLLYRQEVLQAELQALK